MRLKDILIIAFHVVLAFGVYYVPVLAKVYASALIIWVFLVAFLARDPKTILYTAAYVVGAEVFTRMTKGLFFYESLFYESHKYLIMILALAYIFRRGLKKEALIFAGYLLLLLPGLFYTLIRESNNPSFFITNIRKTLAFNLAGPVALGLSAMAWVKERLTLEEFKKLNFWMLMPIISTTFYLILKTPSLSEIVFYSSANFATSGGFGPWPPSWDWACLPRSC